MRKLMMVPLGLLLCGAMMGNKGCEAAPPTARDKNMQAQSSLMERATSAVPVPQVNNFLSREAVAKQVRRLDEKGKLFYVYILGNNGQQMGYYVSNTRPVPTCSLLTPPDDVWKDYNGNGGLTSQRLTAPGLGGTYSPGPCSSVFFFDAATDAYIEIAGLNYFVSDQPLAVKSDPIKIISAQ
ncbi:hypothetical protein JET76_22270 [Pseudomonas putida]|uniref:hypothetical protein n=1 Tax=Pseudomonas putida TaxID=303 RepID=UPI0018E69386|nr:hypothetical protein [Pseudomonas putida]MBI6944060.1 hypothetical protein [Pseudomonas putida]MBI6960140.1 hypothetical protein [Pseudomonas putida]